MNAKSILEDRTISKRFLFPRDKNNPGLFPVYTDINTLYCYKQHNHPGKKMLLVFHGSNEIVTDYLDSFSVEIDQLGYNLFIAEYPGYSQSTGIATLINILEEIPAIVKNCDVPANEIVVFGRSLGTAYAINAINLFPSICGLIIESGIADFYERLNRRVSAEDIETTEEILKEEVLKYFNIEKSLKNYKGNTLIIHTKEDRIISAQHAHQNYEWANEPKTLKLFDEGDHSDIQYCNKVEYFQTIKEFMDNCQLEFKN
jgi:alpha-beta hydrolase superfamily lysophospholipase